MQDTRSGRANARKQARMRKKWRKQTIGHIALGVGAGLVMLIGAVAILLGVAFLGPSRTASDLLAQALLESSALKFVPYLYFDDAEVDAIVARNSIVAPEGDTDVTLVDANLAQQEGQGDENYEPIEIVKIKGGTYKGYLMIVKDPSRVIVGTCGSFSFTKDGKTLGDIIDHYNGVGGTNASGFIDDGGQGSGGMPIGLVISQGEVCNNAYMKNIYATMVGFTEDNVLVIQKMTTQQAIDAKIRDAVAFGPALIVNGVPATITGTSGGVNPRTAIGQRADGAVLLLVIDGRQPNSIGATYADLIEIMQEYGAVNASNLDGGSSSTMMYNGEQLNDGVVLTGGRALPTAFVVLPESEAQ